MTRAQISPHRIEWSTVDALARGSVGPEEVRELRRAERSRTLLLLRAVQDEVVKAPDSRGPLTSLEPAWSVLEQVQQTAPEALESLLSYPYVAGWAGFTLRRLRRGQAADAAPPWVHVGHLHCVAVAAALRAGIDVDLRVPARRGQVALPALGLVRSPSRSGTPWTVARVRHRAGVCDVDFGDSTVRLPPDLGRDASGWWTLRRLECRAGPRTLSLRLDDIDPYRGLYEPLGPDRLDTAQVAVWQELLDGAWHLLCRHDPHLADAMSAGLDALAPYPFTSRFPLISASSGEAFAGITVARPDAPGDLAETLVHEFRHVLLGGLLHLVPLTRQNEGGLLYAPWRDDPRPAAGLLQGIYAFSGVTKFWRAVTRSREEPEGHAEFARARWQAPTLEAARALRDTACLTEAGQRFLEGVEEQLTGWEAEAPYHPAAETTIEDHRAGWRLRHLVPDPGLVTALAREWEGTTDSVTGPYTEELVPRGDGPWSAARADLLRCAVQAGPSPLEPSLVAETGATVADLALVRGRFEEALTGYRAELADDPDRPSSWTGFALAWSRLTTGPGPDILLLRPQLVRAVHRALRGGGEPPQPDALATWLAARLPTDELHARPRTGMA
ncbi:HEXXH motif domain-containing protein [Streptomyces sp. B93]|uniref:HEXXH motif domain-containing protein n=1 Tax=Streptomyces sp. B93 TaxID=2824875 RepID=UPI001B361AD0|nr:HEXXH motif domain-containing protein [Streptomyces sp. B93]MBQ1088355.1 hypothetical protein [Streptomyces sp. B93]